MLILQDELLAPFILDDRLRQAERRYLRSTLPRRPGRLALTLAAIGRLLIAAGTRIETIACRSHANQTSCQLSVASCQNDETSTGNWQLTTGN